MTPGNPKIQFRASRDQCIAWGTAARSADLELNDWIRQTLDRGASPKTKQKRATAPKSLKKSKSASAGLSEGEKGQDSDSRPSGIGQRHPAPSESPFKAKQDARRDWDRDYKKVAIEIRDDWAELNPRP